ncbi:hypothetical protein DYB30_009871 [Aphanomyces astaci]|uniref:Uncharacterized protein n=2 Tax=Aphanomyces astaci TaxID=112090 RepID=A0A397DZ14_APHAT|nr:hypothetical protein DYB30_009871 [Aphanomyces astaci]
MPSQFNATNGPRVQDAMRKFYELQVDKMRKQLAAVLEDKTQAQRLLATERQTHENTVTTLQTSYRRDAAQWKSDKAASEARIALLERRLVAEKASFVELRVSDALAQEMRVYELIQPHVAAADRAAKELHDVASRHAECAATVAALERTARIAKQQQDKSDLALHDMEVERDAVAQQLEAAQAALLEQRRVAVQSDDDDGINWKEKYTALDLDLMRARQRATDLQVDNEQLAQKVQLLSVDKAYLVQDKELTAEKMLQLTRALDDATATCRRLELSKATFLEQIESTREETRTRADAKWTTDVAALRNDLKMKHFEVDAHKAEFAKLEASTGKQIAQLQLAVAAEREKLHAYDKLEVEMDNAILQSGALTDEASATFAMIPTAPKRRIEKLKAKDDEVQTLQRQVTRLDESVARHQQETNTQLQAKLALQNQLQLLLSRRHELDTLKAFVLKAVQTTPSTETGSSSHQQHPHLQPPPTPLDTKVPKWYLKLRQQQPTT